MKTIRNGRDGNNPQSSNYANYDESKANPYPDLPDPLKLNNGKKVTTAKVSWDKRRPEIVEMFDRGLRPALSPRTLAVMTLLAIVQLSDSGIGVRLALIWRSWRTAGSFPHPCPLHMEMTRGPPTTRITTRARRTPIPDLPRSTQAEQWQRRSPPPKYGRTSARHISRGRTYRRSPAGACPPVFWRP